LSSQGPHQLVFGDRRDRQGVGSSGAEAVEDEGKVARQASGAMWAVASTMRVWDQVMKPMSSPILRIRYPIYLEHKFKLIYAS
jgi:hypothetical protein